MRNLKRALSLALASIMLLGMMVTGAGAASNSFTDFDQIVNQEAAEVTTGLGIFDGYTDGSFGPERPVTRAEMAVIICKILNGADVDPANFSGLSKFTDVPGWAEGYVNYCNSMGIVVGVGDNKFDPNRTVSTVEAATMLLKALGYFVEEDQLKSDWKTVVTGRATSLKLYGDLTLGVDEPLTRDNVAELLFHTLFAQRVAYDDNRNLYVKNTDRDVVVTNGTVDKDNTLAMNTFGMWYIDGVVVANSYTRDSLSETVNNAPRTDVVFDVPAEYMGAAATHYAFEYTTNLDMIGHAARVYYKMERNAPFVYAIADRATKVDVISYNTNTTLRADAANEAGFRRNSVLDVNDYWVNYDHEAFYHPGSDDAILAPSDPDNVSGSGIKGAEPNLSLILISNSSDYKVDCVIVLDQYLDTVKRVTERNDAKTYDLTSANGSRQNVALDEAAQGDYIIVTDIGMNHEMLVFEKPVTQTASITKISGTSNPAVTKTITADGTDYKGSPVAHHIDKRSGKNLSDTTNFEQINSVGEVTLILDSTGANARCIAIAEAAEPELYAYVAQYAFRNMATVGFETKATLLAEVYLSDGTTGVYEVNTSANANGNAFYGYKPGNNLNTEKNILNNRHSQQITYQWQANGRFTQANGSLIAALDGTAGAKNAIGVFKASVRADGSIVLTMLANDYADRANQAEARSVKAHSTLVATAAVAVDTHPNPSPAIAVGENVTDDTKTHVVPLHQTDSTAYFYVDGVWGNDLTVVTRNGVKNAENFIASGVNKHDREDPKNGDDSFLQLFSSAMTVLDTARGRRTVTAALVYGLEVEVDKNLYFYKQGSWTANDVTANRAGDNLVDITFELYNMDGELVEHTYTNGGKHYERNEIFPEVSEIPTGWYKIGKDNLESYSCANPPAIHKVDSENGHVWTRDKYVFVIDAVVKHDDYVDNIYTSVDSVGGIALPDDVVVVDLTGTGLFGDVRSIKQACDNGETVKISYCYKENDYDYKTKAVFVTGYSPKGSQGSQDTTVKVAYMEGYGMFFYPSAQAILTKIGLGTATQVEKVTLANAVRDAYLAAGFSCHIVSYDYNNTGYYLMMVVRGLNSRAANYFYGIPMYVTDAPTGATVGGVTYVTDCILVNNQGNVIVTIAPSGPNGMTTPAPDDDPSNLAGQKGVQNVELLNENTLAVGNDATIRVYGSNYSARDVVAVPFTVGNTYIVTVDGVEYEGECKTAGIVDVTIKLTAAQVSAKAIVVEDVELKVSAPGGNEAAKTPVSAITITWADAGDFADATALPSPEITDVTPQVAIVNEGIVAAPALKYKWELIENNTRTNVTGQNAVAGKTYELTVWVEAADTYTLVASKPTVLVGGASTGVSFNNGSGVVTFRTTLAGASEGDTVVSGLTLAGLTALPTTDTDYAAVSISGTGITASVNGTVKKGGTEFNTGKYTAGAYTVEFTGITADEGYTLTGATAAGIIASLPSGITADVSDIANGNLTLSFTVAAAGSGTVVSGLTLSGLTALPTTATDYAAVSISGTGISGTVNGTVKKGGTEFNSGKYTAGAYTVEFTGITAASGYTLTGATAAGIITSLPSGITADVSSIASGTLTLSFTVAAGDTVVSGLTLAGLTALPTTSDSYTAVSISGTGISGTVNGTVKKGGTEFNSGNYTTGAYTVEFTGITAASGYTLTGTTAASIIASLPTGVTANVDNIASGPLVLNFTVTS